ncbi:MAG TPA: IPT/TIG domain-containing protein [Actinomycetota bacterium]
MPARRRILLCVFAVAAALFAPSAARAADPCPAPACITISGAVRGPSFEAVPEYRVLVQRADGYNVTVATNAAGEYAATVPLPSSASQCYQIVGQADAFYANSTTGAKQCATGRVDLSPKVRLQSTLGEQKVYIPYATAGASISIEVSALSRTYPSPFDGAPLPWVRSHIDPLVDGEHEEGYGHDHHGERGVFDAPSVRVIAPGVWQYRWTETMPLDGGPGFYDMDWGRGVSAFDPMMECKMVWFGYGIDSASPSKALPGSTVTLSGRRLGATPGAVVLKGSGQVTTIAGSSIVSWSDSSVTFVVPPLAKTGWVAIVPPSGVASNAQYLDLDPVKVRLP